MNDWFSLTQQEQFEIINETSAQLGFPEVVIEKDWWVCMVLRAVFQSKFDKHIVFKGGTSLSKAYAVIERFSEDVDLIIDYHFLGFHDFKSKSQIKKLRKASGHFVIGDFRVELIEQLKKLGIPEEMFSIEFDSKIDDTSDPNTLELSYQSVVPSETHIQKKVIIEMGARALSEPSEKRKISSYLDQRFQDYDFAYLEFDVEVTIPTKTFLEKVFLLHEEFSKPIEKIRHHKLSRHLYDLDRLMNSEYGEKAIADKNLFNKIVEFRELMNNGRGISFENHKRDRLNIIPPVEVIDLWEADYRQMQESMIVGDRLPFNELIEKMQIIQRKFKSNSI
ncbi:nucleotidyl transferase AbiEii/AbiGii toxin family protein [Kaistella sp.]|uniref:nucleotidyl transferase AbiEii/AbiGii toxin family protein n=1 Tax=Kaistella sp. TaxID=2782235 RepID=UPI003C659D6F